MCGFFGYISKASLNKKTKKKIKKIDCFLSNRGPDFSGNLIGKNYFLKHWRLKIQDLNDRSNQPFTDINGNLLYNGELYNFKKLKQKKNLIYNFKTTGDTEVLFKLIKEKGIDETLKSIEGMFSFVYQDKKKDRIFLARDRFGQKPLYYFIDQEKFIFSSEIKPIIFLLEGKIKVNYNQLEDYIFQNLYYEKRNTFFKNIKQVLPGKYLVFENFNVTENSYYNSLNVIKDKKKFKISSFKKYITETIDKHLIADKDICLSLSSGLDSKSLLALISRSKFKNNLKKSYTFLFESFKSEDKDAEKFSNIIGVKNEKILITKKDIIKNFKNLIQINEGPIGGIANIAMLLLCKKIKKDGFNILLAGYGMDEALFGYNSFNFSKNLSKNNFRVPDLTSDFNYFHRNYVNYFKNYEGDRLKNQILFRDKIPRTVHMCDRFSMVNSIELRLPYLDHKFIENVSNFFYEDYFYENNLISKKPLREYLKSLNIKNASSWIFQKKHNPSPQNSWLREEPIKSWVFHHLNSNKIYKKLYFFSKKEILEAWKIFSNNKKNQLNGYFFWQLVNLYYLVDIKNFNHKALNNNTFYKLK